MGQVQIFDQAGKPISSVTVRPDAEASAYIGADRDSPEFRNWHPSRGSVEDDLGLGTQRRLGQGARDLERNDGQISGAVQSHKDRVIGAGLRLRSLPDHRALGITPEAAKDKAHELEAVFGEWGDNPLACDAEGHSNFGGLTRLSTHTDFVEGESLTVVAFQPQRQKRLGSRFGTVLQVVDPDRLVNPQGHDRFGNNRVVDGVELDRFGLSVAFHIANRHPHSRFSKPGEPFEVARKPRFNRGGMVQVLHNFEKKRAGQHRGVSVFAPILSTSLMQRRYKRAELSAAVVNAVIAAVLETPIDGASMEELFGSADNYLEKRKADSAPLQFGLGVGGTVPQLYPGEKLSGFNGGRPNQAFDPFLSAINREISAAIGQTYETFTKDFSKTNYSSARASLLEAWRFVMTCRVFKAMHFCLPIYGRVIDEAVIRGYIDLPGYLESKQARHAWLKSSWLGPGLGWIDPVKEVQAAVMRIRAGLSAPSDEAALQGRDLDEVVAQSRSDLQLFDEAGLVFPEIDFSLAGSASRETDNED